ncbi:MAG: hypothetical protein ACMXYE_05570 [Candidatus Woesearchaeota archaeon]
MSYQKEQHIFDVEIAPRCNYKCPTCLLGNRLHPANLNERRYDPELTEKIIAYIPRGSHLNYVGLGEPTLFQDRIIKIHTERQDTTGHIQTNGTNKLEKELQQLINKKIISVGLSYDPHHEQGNTRKLHQRIQPEYVDSISIATNSESHTIDMRLKEKYSRLDHILLDPFFDENMTITINWETMKRALRKARNENPNTRVWTGLQEAWIRDENNTQYFHEAIKDGLHHLEERWYEHSDGFIVRIEDPTFGGLIRILTDGHITSNTFDMIKSWEEIDKLQLKKIESLGG